MDNKQVSNSSVPGDFDELAECDHRVAIVPLANQVHFHFGDVAAQPTEFVGCVACDLDCGLLVAAKRFIGHLRWADKGPEPLQFIVGVGLIVGHVRSPSGSGHGSVA